MCGDARFKERTGMGKGGGGEVLTWASGYNFPLFLVYPVDMPDCLTASTARALLCMADVEFRIQVMAEVVVACPEPEHCHLFLSG